MTAIEKKDLRTRIDKVVNDLQLITDSLEGAEETISRFSCFGSFSTLNDQCLGCIYRAECLDNRKPSTPLSIYRACFGNFDEKNEKCLDCIECSECDDETMRMAKA